MDISCIEEDENYQVHCGEMFFTKKGRLIFHCSLCEGKFDEFSLYEFHIHKDHILSTFDDENEYEEHAEYVYEDDDYMFEEQSSNVNYEKVNANDPLFNKILANKINDSERKTQLNNLIKTENEQDIEVVNEINLQQNLVSTTNLKLETLEVTREVRKVTFSKSQIAEEERKHKCPICNTGFKEKHNMQHHLKRHTNKRDHKCPECDKSFYFKSEVRIHLRSHTSERPYLCNICGNSFVHNSLLLAHLRRHSGQKTKKCEVCGKAFFNNSDLKKHMAGHSDERPYSCEICSASFARSRTLKNHLKLHNNKMEYKCKICDNRFNQRAGLTSHMKSVHKTSNF